MKEHRLTVFTVSLIFITATVSMVITSPPGWDTLRTFFTLKMAEKQIGIHL